ncbi:hypothetical protein BCR32DRAFT_290872 [Anaeromyces robustus]|uniref:LysM domain-containing protein n=1 Tax=Anaeromyces robustus TaxID=1754192 RepID=A0A1Y1XHH9_9FUNG|nr:hypothetical protein BCR32DRAFT_290872 [Anaeromyces robustus]|eukprot:ORX85209.1 hypothetical protein BCR32DRAFT_290872 [Anaeromyces robustus]
MKLSYFALFLTLVLINIVQINAKGFYCTKYIVLKKGDKCSHITSHDSNKDYYLRYKDLMYINPKLDCDNIRSGTKVCVDVDYMRTDEDHPFDEYVIQKKDTCKSIARKLKTTVKIIENTNLDILYCDKIKQLEDVEIQYRKDGDYEPIYDKKSQLVTIDGKE